ncbi:uncharacterized protein LOC128330732 [Hemicordylus capensis]|uniref:uncharacterized protein LOC128330732 n=1 Tax=Hemicordylus capensis TaxID=884348 RepID=UPI0023028325|nr:uncharacterized protein LOC128330732 [Hemicordylus capensis]
MGEPNSSCHLSPEGCCLDLQETVVILVALIILVQLALRLATVLCYYVCCLLGSLVGMIFAKEDTKLKAAAPKVKKAQTRKLSAQWSEQEIPRRRQRSESSSPQRRCLHCTLEPVRVTMNLQNETSPFGEQPRFGRRLYPDYPPLPSPRYFNCECEARPRLRTASAPSAYAVTRYRDVGCGSSEPILSANGSAPAPQTNALVGPVPDPFPRPPVGETPYHAAGAAEQAEYPRVPQRSHRPAKVYIYPVHPQTPPGSRSASPERLHRRRRALTSSQEEQPRDRSSRERHRRAREPEPHQGIPSLSRLQTLSNTVGGPSGPGMGSHNMGGPGMGSHNVGGPGMGSHNMSVPGMGSHNVGPKLSPLEPSPGKKRYLWSDQITSTPDWVFRPAK